MRVTVKEYDELTRRAKALGKERSEMLREVLFPDPVASEDRARRTLESMALANAGISESAA